MPLTEPHKFILSEALRSREDYNLGGLAARGRFDGDQAT